MKTITLNNQAFTLTANFADMDQQALIALSEAVLRELGNATLNMTSEVNFILQASYENDNAPFCFDDIENYTATAEYYNGEKWLTLTEEERDDLIDELEDNRTDENDEETDQKIDALNELDFQYPEIMQWFYVDDRLLRRLNKIGECVLENKYWGRCTFGQSIVLDYCIQQACYDLAVAWAN